jgi:hypothetical protein
LVLPLSATIVVNYPLMLFKLKIVLYISTLYM